METTEEPVYFIRIFESNDRIFWRRGEWYMMFSWALRRRVDCRFKWIGFERITYPYCGPGGWTRYWHITLFNHELSLCLSKGRYDGTNKCSGG